MKKQIFTLAVCLAVSATSALAETAKIPTKTVPVTLGAKLEQKTCETTKKPCEVMQPNEAVKKQFEAKMAKERELFHQALNLTEEQKKKAQELDCKAKAAAEPLFAKMKEDKAKLKNLISQKAAEEEIAKQKALLSADRKALKKHFDASRKDFEAILTKDQLAKLKILHEQRKTEMKKHEKCKCHKCGEKCKCKKCEKCSKEHGPNGPGGHGCPPPFPFLGDDGQKGVAQPKCNCGK